MAFDVSFLDKTVFGNERVHHYSMVADAATAAIDTGFDFIYSAQLTFQSAASGNQSLRINQLAAGTSTAGYIAITGVASGDEMFVTVYGR